MHLFVLRLHLPQSTHLARAVPLVPPPVLPGAAARAARAASPRSGSDVPAGSSPSATAAGGSSDAEETSPAPFVFPFFFLHEEH